MAKTKTAQDATIRGSYSSGIARRQSILDATILLLSEVGFNGLSMRDIARRVGISHPGVIYHFPTKESLLMAVIEEHEKRVGLNLDKVEALPALEALQAMLEVCMALESDPVITEVECQLTVEASSSYHPAHDHFANRLRRINEIVANALRELQRRDIIVQNVSVKDLAYLLTASGVGLQTQLLYAAGDFDIRALLIQMLVRYVNFDNPQSLQLVLTLGVSSPAVVKAVRVATGRSIIDLIDNGDIQLTTDLLQTYGLDMLPADLIARALRSGLVSPDHIAHSARTKRVSLDLLGQLVAAGVLTAADLEILEENEVVSTDTMAALSAVVVARESLALRDEAKRAGKDPDMDEFGADGAEAAPAPDAAPATATAPADVDPAQ